MHSHELVYNTSGNTMFSACKNCGMSAKVKMQGTMTERKGMVYRNHQAKAKLYGHLMASLCVKEPVAMVFPLI